MRFVDLDNWLVYNGDKPYIHWFNDEQSTNIVYTKRICFLNSKKHVSVNMESKIFSLLDLTKLPKEEIINDFKYKDISKIKTNELDSVGYLYDLNGQHIYIHVIYFCASSIDEGEFLEDFYIDNESFTIGSSFYREYEPNKINLANFGLEFPDSIQKSIYTSNVHEDEIDNILLNRKYKELLNEYWNIIANKGSYKSLYNSLSWFEYRDLVRLQKVYKNRDFYNLQDVFKDTNDDIKIYLNKQKQTTYLGLYLALYKELTDDNNRTIYPNISDYNNNSSEDSLFNYATLDRALNTPQGDLENGIFTIGIDNVDISYENGNEDFEINNNIFTIDHSDWDKKDEFNYKGFLREDNPILIDIASKWTNEDLSLKMYLLGNFFKTYFMPIHLDLIHSTIEHIVYTNTYKNIINTKVNRTDTIDNIDTFNCNIKDDDLFFLNDVNIQVGPNTLVGTQWNNNDYDDIFILGVDDNIDRLYNENDLKTFMSQHYNGVGKIIEFICKLDYPDILQGISVKLQYNNKIISNSSKLLLNTEQQDVKFKILCTEIGSYSISIELKSTSGKVYTKNIKFNITDVNTCSIKLYKVKYNKNHKNNNISVDNYLFANYDRNDKTYDYINQYISKLKNNNTWGDQDSIVLNRTIICNEYITKDQIANIIKDLSTDIINNIKVYYKYNLDDNYSITDKVKYTIIVFPYGVPENYVFNYPKDKIIRDDYGFYPENHHLEELYSDFSSLTIEDISVTNRDVLMIVPDIRYIKYITDYEWEFENISKVKHNKIILKSIKTPFIANTEYQLLDPGFYNIKFRYRLVDKIQEISLNSAFIAK